MARLRLSHWSSQRWGSEGGTAPSSDKEVGPFISHPHLGIYYVPSYGKVAQLLVTTREDGSRSSESSEL